MNSPYLSCLKTYWAEIWNLSWLPPNILLAPILVLLWPSLIFFSLSSMCNVFLTPEQAPKAGPCHLFSNRNKFILVYIIGTKWRHSILCQKCFKECLFTDSESVHNILFPDSVSVLNILFNELQTWTHCHWNVNVTITP